ncbi:MAG: glyoxalase [Bacteroidota bacterium]
MSVRDSQILALRPEIPVQDTFGNEVEAFQHTVLRPILKAQNELILMQFKSWLGEHKQKPSLEKALELIPHAMKTHKRLRATYFGMITGWLTVEEYAFYLDNQREIHRRITTMLIERVRSQREALDLTQDGI